MYYWISSFKSLDGEEYQVSIEDSTLEADQHFDLGAKAVEINIERGDHKYAPLRSRSATIHVASPLDMSTIYSELWDRAVTVTRVSDSHVEFTGWVVPAQWAQDVHLGVNEYTIEAQDSIGKLCHVKYTMVSSANGRQVVTYDALLGRAAALIGLNGAAPSEWSDISISEDAFLPDDWTLDNSDSDWMTWGEIVEAMCLSTGKSVMIEAGYLQVFDLDELSTTWISDAEELAQDMTLTMEIEPAVNRVECKPALGKKVWLNDPLSDERVWFGWKGQDPDTLIMSYVDDDGKRVYYYPASGHKDITNYASVITRYYVADDDDGAGHKIGQGAKSSNTIFGIQPSTTPTWDARSLHANAYPDAWMQIKLTLFCNTRDQSTPYPREWLESEGDEYDTPALQLKVGNTVMGPSTAYTTWESAHKGFFDITYSFPYVPQGQMSLVWRSSTEKWFVKAIKVYPSVTSEDFPPLVELLTNDFDNELSVDIPFVVGGQGWIHYKGNAYYSGSSTDTEQWWLQERLATQYGACRRRFRITLPIAGFALDSLVTLRGYTCTIEAAEMDLKRGVVTVTLLEVGA